MIRSGPKPLVFLHIPKTGGTTLRALLSCHFSPEEIAHVPDEESLNSELVGSLAGSHTLKNKHQDDRPIRFAVSRLLLMQFSPTEHPKFSKRLLQVVHGLANPETSNPYSESLQELAYSAQQKRHYQPHTHAEVAWCSPIYQRNRLRLLEQQLPKETPTQSSQSMQQLYHADPVLMAELLFFLFPHIEPVRQ